MPVYTISVVRTTYDVYRMRVQAANVDDAIQHISAVIDMEPDLIEDFNEQDTTVEYDVADAYPSELGEEADFVAEGADEEDDDDF